MSIKGQIRDIIHYFKYHYWALVVQYYSTKKKPKVTETQISVAITHYQNYHKIHFSLFNLLLDSRVKELVILDDCSSDENFQKLKQRLRPFKERVRLYKREQNWGVFPNKIQVVSLCSCDWVLLIDADNTYFNSSLDALFQEFPWNRDLIYCPGFAYPHFDFRNRFDVSELFFTKVKEWKNSEDYFAPFLNDGNYFLNRDEFVNILKPYFKTDVFASDVVFANYIWLSNSKGLRVLPNLWYLHRVHNESTWLRNKDASIRVLEPLDENISQGKPVDDGFINQNFEQKKIEWIEPELVQL